MTTTEIFELVVNSQTPPPVMLCDGQMGLLIQTCKPNGDCGVQVPGEPDMRWINHGRLMDMGGGALMEVPSP